MTEVTFVCRASEPFDLFGLDEAIEREAGAEIQVLVRHPDREADGSCRWCGCREDEVVTVRGTQLEQEARFLDERLMPVIEEANENRAFFEEFCRSLTPPQLAAMVPRTPWRTKDYIAHLATIDLYVGEWFEHVASGRRWRPNNSEDGSPFNIDTWNQARIDERYDATVEELLDEAAEHRAELWSIVDRFTPEVLDTRFNFRDRDITYLRYLQVWTAHDPAHSADMLRGIPERLDNLTKAWLEKYRIPVG